MSRMQGLSPRTIVFYEYTHKPFLHYCRGEILSETINSFLASLNCSNRGKHAYYRGIDVLVNYLVKSGQTKDNPLLKVESPKPSSPILPSLTLAQVQSLIESADTLRDQCIISLLADSDIPIVYQY